MGPLPSRPGGFLQRQGTVISSTYYSFTLPAALSFTVSVNTVASPIALQASLGAQAPFNGSWAPKLSLATAGAGSSSLFVSARLNANDPTSGIAAGQTWYVRIQSAQPSAVQFNLTVQTRLDPTPAPSAGFISDVEYGGATPIEVPQLPLSSYVYYRLVVPAASPGFRVDLTPLFNSDPDLFLSTRPPSGANNANFTAELRSERGAGVVDDISLTPGDAQWQPSLNASVYYLQVKAYSACGFQLQVVPLVPSASPAPFLPTVQPSPGTLPEITGAAPIQHTLNLPPAGGAGGQPSPAPSVNATIRQCYRYRSSPASGDFTVEIKMPSANVNVTGPGASQPVYYGPVALAVYYSWPPVILPGQWVPVNRVLYREPSLPLVQPPNPNVPEAVRGVVSRATTTWIGFAGEYFVCAEIPPTFPARTAPATYRMSIANNAATPSASPRPIVITDLAAATLSGNAVWGGYRFYRFVAPAAGPVSFRVIPARSTTTGGGILPFVGDASGDPSGWWNVRRSGQLTGGVLQLTNGVSQRGYGWFSERRQVWPSFGFTFDFTLSRNGVEPAGEGFCFVIQNDARGEAAESNWGDGFGISNGMSNDGDTPFPRIRRSVSICIDANMQPAPADGGGGAGVPPGTVPFPRSPSSMMATFVSLEGNMTCQRRPGLETGCAFPLPDLTVGSQQWTVSVRTARVGATNDTLVDWGIYNSYSGEAVGNWNVIVPDFYSLLDLRSQLDMARVGFAGGTSSTTFLAQSIMSHCE